MVKHRGARGQSPGLCCVLAWTFSEFQVINGNTLKYSLNGETLQFEWTQSWKYLYMFIVTTAQVKHTFEQMQDQSNKLQPVLASIKIN